MAYAAGATAGAAAAAEEAKKALIGGLLVEVGPELFMNLASENRERICITGEIGTIRKKKVYAFSIDGLVIMTKTEGDIHVPNKVYRAKDIHIPSL
jgi:hypothetical protein